MAMGSNQLQLRVLLFFSINYFSAKIFLEYYIQTECQLNMLKIHLLSFLPSLITICWYTSATLTNKATLSRERWEQGAGSMTFLFCSENSGRVLNILTKIVAYSIFANYKLSLIHI